MKTIKQTVKSQYEIQKSKFITTLYRIDSIEEGKQRLEEIKMLYPDASHHCYAYLLKEQKKCSDDNEPSGTAGLPILNVLEQNHLDHILAIVTRYFGGTKLGTGGLVRAYSKSVTSALNLSEIVELEAGKQIKIIFSYDQIKAIDFILRDQKIIYKEYDEFITYEFIVSNEHDTNIMDQLKPLVTNLEIQKEMYI